MALLQRTTARLVPKLPSAPPRQTVQPTALRRGGKKPARRCLFGRCGTVASGAAITVSAPSADFDAPRKGLFDLLRRRSGRSAQTIAVTQAGVKREITQALRSADMRPYDRPGRRACRKTGTE